MKNIILVGFMGTGKTQVAKLVSKNTGLEYVSTDDLIEKREKKTINDIFKNQGEECFREIESEVVRFVSTMKNVVVDAGGGVVINPENLKNLKETGIVICLWASPSVIYERTKRHSHRPLLSVKDPLKKITNLLEARKPFYERADYHINTSEMTLSEVAEEVEKAGKK